MEDFVQNQRARKWLTLVHTGLTHLITRACATGRQPATPQTNEWACISRELPCNTLTMELMHMLNNKTKIRLSYTLTAQTLLRWIDLLVFRLTLSNFSLPIGGWSESTSENIEVPTRPLKPFKALAGNA